MYILNFRTLAVTVQEFQNSPKKMGKSDTILKLHNFVKIDIQFSKVDQMIYSDPVRIPNMKALATQDF